MAQAEQGMFVEGRVERITRSEAVGWAWIPQEPDEVLRVEAVLHGRVLGWAFADQPRPDLARARVGTSRYGFRIVFERNLAGTKVPTVRAFGARASIVLPGARILISADRVAGGVDRLTRLDATGWAWMPDAPERHVAVEAVLHGIVIGTAVACEARHDLSKAGIGSGRYGFHIEFNTELEGVEAPTFRVAGPKGATLLPAAKTLPAELVEAHVDDLTRFEARGWAWAPAEPHKTIRVEAVLDGRILGRTIANQPRADLVKEGIGTGRYGFKLAFDEPLVGETIPTLQFLAPAGQIVPPSIDESQSRQFPPTRFPRRDLAGLLADHRKFTSPGPEFEEFDAQTARSLVAHSDVLLIAFYLPQFHSIPENDEFWGSGFTEWRQLAKSIPRFPGHYQPRIPRDLGFYDLRTEDAIRKQTLLAQSAGIGAFAFYYYWLDGRRVLELPLERYLASDNDMPFVLLWANENWTRTWDGMEKEVLLRQDYNSEDALIADLARHFQDKRYLRLAERPLFIIYNPGSIPEPVETIARWRHKFDAKFSLNPLIFMAQTFGHRDPIPYGFDGALEFPPHKLSDNCPGRPTPDAYSPEFQGRIIAYDDLVEASVSEETPDYPIIKTVVPGWDNDARRPNHGLAVEGSSPPKYENWLRALISRALQHPIFGTPLVAINSWNEWAECSYLEPDIYYGAAYLNATARARAHTSQDYHRATSSRAKSPVEQRRISVIVPNYNHAQFLEERLRSILTQNHRPDEIIFLDDCSDDHSVDLAKLLLQQSNVPFTIHVNPRNSGSVFRQWAKGIALAKHDLIWIAESDDSADSGFLSAIIPAFAREEVMLAFGRLKCIGADGEPLDDLETYYHGLRRFSWQVSQVTPAYQAFSGDFAVKNVIPNVSGAVLRKPDLSSSALDRMAEYRFAGDWFFYSLVARGGAIAYCAEAHSYFRVKEGSASRGLFSTERHLSEHLMVLHDLRKEYGLSTDAIASHVRELSATYRGKSSDQIYKLLPTKSLPHGEMPFRVCIAAHSFDVGGGELLPIELANQLKNRGHHVTYLVMERGDTRKRRLRYRLRRDIAVVYWDEIKEDFAGFMKGFGIQIFNSHNITVEYYLYLERLVVGVPFFVSLHGGYESTPEVATAELIEYLKTVVCKFFYLSDASKVFLAAKGVAETAFERSYNAISVFRGSAVERDTFRRSHQIPLDALVLVLCSRAIREKGWQIAVDVARGAGERSQKAVHLVLIGDGPEADAMRAANIGASCVTFMGEIENPRELLDCFDLGIFPSTFTGEIFPLFLVECFQAGLPVIATDIGAISSMMGPEPTDRPGELVSWKKGAEEITEEMIGIVLSVMENSALYTRMRASAFATSNRFSMDGLADLYVEQFRHAMTIGHEN